MTNSLDESAVAHVAQLARLKTTDAEIKLYAQQLSKILEYVAQLNELDTTNVPPTAHPIPISNVFRRDAVKDCWTAERALLNAPDRAEGYFKVPKVLEQETA